MSMVAQHRRRREGRAGDIVLLILVLGLIWQAFYQVAGDVALTPPLATVGYAVGLMSSPDFWPNVRATFAAFGLAVLISVGAGLPTGVLLGLNKLAGDAAEPVLVALYSVPKVVFYPVILLCFGIGLAPEVAFGVVNGVLPIVIFTMNAMAHVKPIYLKTGRA
ncbi:MAG TPA: ABC transporter permease, partial [bacterium]|nr:ABC transporter permease [bacterium]